MKLDLTSLRLFLAVHEERSMARAAEREHITAPAISKRIAELEATLGVSLFERLSTGIRPTPAGDALFLEVRGVFHALDRAKSRLSEYASGERGSVRILCNPSGLMACLADDLKTFVEAHGAVTLHVDERRSTEVIRGVAEAVAEIGIFARGVDAENLTVVPYRTVDLVLLVPADHPLAARTAVSFAEAAQHELVTLGEESAIGALVQRIAAAQGVELRSRISVTSFEALREMVRAGLGIGIAAAPRGPRPLQRGGVAEVGLTETWATYRLNLCTRDPDTLPAAARRLVEHLIRGRKADKQQR